MRLTIGLAMGLAIGVAGAIAYAPQLQTACTEFLRAEILRKVRAKI